MRRRREARKQLQRKILLQSIDRHNFHRAKGQWIGIDFLYDGSGTSMCECDQPRIKRLWIIYNIHNKRKMQWIGSCCIKHFGIKTIGSQNPKKTLPFNNHILDQYWGKKQEKISQKTSFLL